MWLLGLASLLNDVSSEAIFPLLPIFLAQLGAPMRYLGLIEGSADALASVIKMISGRLSDRGPRRLMVTGGYTLPALARAGIALAVAPWHVLAARLVDRAGKGIRSGPRDAMLADAVAPTERGRAFGLNRSMDHLGAAVGPLIASALVALGVGLRATFVVAAVLGLVAPVVLFLRLRDGAHAARSDEAAGVAADGALRPGFFSYLGVCVLFALGNSSDAFLLVRAREVGWSAAALPLLWLFHHLVKSAAALPGGALSDRHSRAVVVSAGWAAYARHLRRLRLRDGALARPRALPRLRALSRPRRGRRARHHRRPRRARRPRPRVRPLPRVRGRRGAAGRPRRRGSSGIAGARVWALGLNAALRGARGGGAVLARLRGTAAPRARLGGARTPCACSRAARV